MEDQIRELFATLLQVSPQEIADQTQPADIARWDSMQHLILVSGFEEEFHVEIEPEEAVDMYKDFAAFKKVVLQKLKTRQ